VLRRILLATVLVAASTTMAVPAANAGQAKTDQCPTSSAGHVGVKVLAAASPATISVTDTRTSTPLRVVVTIDNVSTAKTFTITAPMGATYTLASGSWCLKSSLTTASVTSGTTLTGTSPSTNKNGTLQNISYVTVYSVSSGANTCYDDTTSSVANYFDLLVTGPVGQYGNAYQTNSIDGSCSGGPREFDGQTFVYTVVKAMNPDDAAATCAGLSTPSGVWDQVSTIWGAPPSSDLWICDQTLVG
jgi:hypothetical protein